LLAAFQATRKKLAVLQDQITTKTAIPAVRNTASLTLQAFEHDVKSTGLQKTVIVACILVLLAFLPSQADTQLQSPLHQSKSGTAVDQIACAPDLQIIMKKTDGSPACVKAASVAKLIESGWGVHVLPRYVKDEPKNSGIFELGKKALRRISCQVEKFASENSVIEDLF